MRCLIKKRGDEIKLEKKGQLIGKNRLYTSFNMIFYLS